MNDLISRAAAIEYLMTNMGWHDDDGYTVDDADEKRAIITDLVNGIPAVDAAPVIRCANCKWWNESTLGVAHRCAALHIATTGEFYCAAAERKSNAFADQSGAEYADNPTV